MYYLQSRYYDPVVGRFISPDILVSTGQGMLGNNMFAYCNNNPIIHYDQTGTALDTVLDIVSLGTSLADVVINPASPVAWFSLAADVACLVLPGVTGGGGLVLFVAGAEKLADAANFVDDVVDASKAISTTKEAGKAIHDTYMTLDKTKDIFTNKALGTIFEEVTSKLRPDAVDTLNCIVYELKPYNTNSFSRAIKQVQKYLDIIPDDLKNWTVVIDMYY